MVGPSSWQVLLELFWTFGPCIHSYQAHLKRVIYIDENNLMGKYFSNLLVAYTCHAQPYLPLAFAILESKNKDCWSLFLKLDAKCDSRHGHESSLSPIDKIDLSKSCPLYAHHAFASVNLARNLYGGTRDNMAKKYVHATVRQFIEVGFHRTRTAFDFEFQ